jgi:hypothetical protein
VSRLREHRRQQRERCRGDLAEQLSARLRRLEDWPKVFLKNVTEFSQCAMCAVRELRKSSLHSGANAFAAIGLITAARHPSRIGPTASSCSLDSLSLDTESRSATAIAAEASTLIYWSRSQRDVRAA